MPRPFSASTGYSLSESRRKIPGSVVDSVCLGPPVVSCSALRRHIVVTIGLQRLYARVHVVRFRPKPFPNRPSQGVLPWPNESADRASHRGGVSEIRIDVGPGYGLYFVRRAETEYLLLAGGDKWTQVRDIRRAKTMMR